MAPLWTSDQIKNIFGTFQKNSYQPEYLTLEANNLSRLFSNGVSSNNGGLFGNIDLQTAMLLSNGDLAGVNMNNLMLLNLWDGNQVTSGQMVAPSALNASQIDKNVFSRYNQK